MIFKFTSKGEYHSEGNMDNQDVIQSGENDRFIVISLADGVSSCKRAKEGAELACREITSMLLKKGDYFLEFEPGQTAAFILSHIQYELKNKADEENADIEEYSSTLTSVLYDKEKKKLLFFNLGDGIILTANGSQCQVVSMPSDSTNGCCVTTTENAEKTVSVKVTDAGRLDSIIICSDGAWRQLFENGRLIPEAADDLKKGDFNDLKTFMEGKARYDDSSFISMDLGRKMRESA